MDGILNPLISAFKAQQAPDVMPALGTSIAMPSPVPSLGAPSPPSVVAPIGTTQGDMNERSRLVDSGSGVSQIQNPLLRGIARAADIAGSVFAPKIAQFIPGTTLHHQLLVGQATQNVANDQAEDQSAAKTVQDKALAAQETAKAAALANPQKAVDPSKTVQTDDGVFQLNPDTGKYDIRVGDRVEKPKSPEQQVYDSEIAAGKSPVQAFQTVNQSKNTKDASFQQQFLDAYQKAHPEVPLTDAISATIKATSTEPKISVINAAAADRAAATNSRTAPLDTSDPAMQASVASVAKGDLKLSEVFGRGATTAQKAQFVAAVKEVNPAYNSGDHDIENSARRYMISGQGGQTLNAINTAYHHLDLFDTAADALKNGNVKALNQVANELGIQVQNGVSAPVVFNLVKTALTGELGKSFTGAGATVDEQKNLSQSLGSANNDATYRQVSGTARALLRGKETALAGQLSQGEKGQANFGALNNGGAAEVYTRDASGKLVKGSK